MPTHTQVSYRDLSPGDPILDERTVVVVGRAERLRTDEVLAWTGLSEATRNAMVDATKPGDGGASAESWVGSNKVVLGVLLLGPVAWHKCRARRGRGSLPTSTATKPAEI